MGCARPSEQDALSESVQMYLVAIARLRDGGDPVGLSRLARELEISPVSVNAMCRRLQEQGLLVYQPYHGVSLTDEGERRAHYILRRHRLWEVLLVDRLSITYEEAHDMACALEHATPDVLADRLDAFLGHPTVNPIGEPIPRPDGTIPERPSVPLASLAPGQSAEVTGGGAPTAALAFLAERGLRPGCVVRVTAAGDDALLVEVDGTHLALSRALAEQIAVRTA
jgi:DtxR family Mn-dependent transcriptional regulator